MPNLCNMSRLRSGRAQVLVRESICSAFARQAHLPIISDKSLSLSSQSLPPTLKSLALIPALLLCLSLSPPLSLLLTVLQLQLHTSEALQPLP